MLDKFALKLLNILIESAKSGDYIVLSFDDIKSKFKKNEINNTLLNNTLSFLCQNEYIKIKFKDEDQICYCCLTKSRLIDETKLISKNNKKETSKLLVLNIIFSCLSAFIGAFLAILIVHFFL